MKKLLFEINGVPRIITEDQHARLEALVGGIYVIPIPKDLNTIIEHRKMVKTSEGIKSTVHNVTLTSFLEMARPLGRLFMSTEIDIVMHELTITLNIPLNKQTMQY